ncbi:MAG: hypothetical protein QOG62_2622 [Thermoleophilaceae bacterium]|nr:hypothetical protein [Thermoleophilaceae bacterium]
MLADIRRNDVETIWCLGDLVGYGASPNECVALAAEVTDVCLVGNHDLVVLERLDISTFSPAAAQAARWTRTRLDKESRDFMSGLEPGNGSLPIGIFHASPRDPVWEYVLSPVLADASLDAMEQRVGAVGHSHVALSFNRPDGGRTAGDQAPGGQESDISEGRWLLNPGAVGQPRDGDPRAAWLIVDMDKWTASWMRTRYDIEEAADAIRDAGLPATLADRLYYGQ